MSVYLGVDFHARTQTVCWCDTADGLIHQRTLDHERDDVRVFYTQFAVPAVVGLETSCEFIGITVRNKPQTRRATRAFALQ